MPTEGGQPNSGTTERSTSLGFPSSSSADSTAPMEAYYEYVNVLARMNGIRATVWANPTDKGVRYNTTFERSYRDGEEWKTTDSYGRDDLLVLAYVAKEAFRWIVSQTAK